MADYGATNNIWAQVFSNDMNKSRLDHMDRMNQMYQQWDQRENRRVQQEMGMQDYLSKVDDYAFKVGTSREKDKNDLQNLANVGMDKIQIELNKYGGNVQKFFRAGGYKLLKEYKDNLLKSDLYGRLHNNQQTLKSLKQAQDQNPNLIFLTDALNYDKWQKGEVDHLTYRGLKEEIDTTYIEHMDRGQEIDVNTIINWGSNEDILKRNMIREFNLPADAEVTTEILQAYVQERYGTDIGKFGEKDIRVDVGSNLKTHLFDGISGLKIDMTELTSFLEEGGNLNHYLNNKGYLDAVKVHYGISDQTVKFKKRWGGIHATNKLFDDNPYTEILIGNELFKGYKSDFEDGKRKIYKYPVKGLYSQKNGQKIGKNDLKARGLSELFDAKLNFNGFFIGLKANVNGVDILMMNPSDPAERAEYLEKYGDADWTPTLVAELYDKDRLTLKSGWDYYYKEVNWTPNLQAQINTQAKDYNVEIQNAANINQINKNKAEINNQKIIDYENNIKELANIYGNGEPKNIKTLLDIYANPIWSTFQGMDIPKEMLPITLAELMVSVENHEDSNMAVEDLMNKVSNYSKLINDPSMINWKNVLKSGKVQDYYSLLSTKYDEDVVDRIKTISELWLPLMQTFENPEKLTE
jgi:hypothetical protein